jgi:hypothetical protein
VLRILQLILADQVHIEERPQEAIPAPVAPNPIPVPNPIPAPNPITDPNQATVINVDANRVPEPEAKDATSDDDDDDEKCSTKQIICLAILGPIWFALVLGFGGLYIAGHISYAISRSVGKCCIRESHYETNKSLECMCALTGCYLYANAFISFGIASLSLKFLRILLPCWYSEIKAHDKNFIWMDPRK